MEKDDSYGSLHPGSRFLLRLGAVNEEPPMYSYSNRSRHLSGKNYCLSPLSNPGGLFKIRRKHIHRIVSGDGEGNNGEVKADGKIIRKREIKRFEKGE